MKDEYFFKSGSLFINSTIIMLVITIFGLVIEKFTFATIMSNNENHNKRVLFMIPMVNIAIITLFTINQLTNYFTKLEIVGPMFRTIQLGEKHFDVVQRLVYYSIIENCVIILYLMSIAYVSDRESLKMICGSDKITKVNKLCAYEITNDIYMYSAIVKIIFVILFFMYSMFQYKVSLPKMKIPKIGK
jgi:hypothetical protein